MLYFAWKPLFSNWPKLKPALAEAHSRQVTVAQHAYSHTPFLNEKGNLNIRWYTNITH